MRADLRARARRARRRWCRSLEGIPLWHERDISHSSVERIALPDAAIGTDYLLHLTPRLVNGLVVNAERMQANLESTGGLIYSSAVLLELVEGGMSREDAYAITQAAAMETWRSGTPFRETLRKHAADSGPDARRGAARRGVPAGAVPRAAGRSVRPGGGADVTRR